jgi:Zn-dependent protease
MGLLVKGALEFGAVFALSVVVHEGGHILAARKCGFRLRATRVRSAFEVKLVRVGKELSKREAVWIAAAGPLASFELALCAIQFGWMNLALVSALGGAASLLPIRPQDGYKIVRALRGARVTSDVA